MRKKLTGLGPGHPITAGEVGGKFVLKEEPVPKIVDAPKEYRFYDLLKVLSDEAGHLSGLMADGDIGVEGQITVVPGETTAAVAVTVDAEALATWLVGYLKGSLPAEVFAIIDEISVGLVNSSGLSRTVRLRRNEKAVASDVGNSGGDDPVRGAAEADAGQDQGGQDEPGAV